MSDSCQPPEGGQEESQHLLFQDLPTDVLMTIFDYCDIRSLLSLSQTCKRINYIINEDFVWLERSRLVCVSNQVSDEIKNRSFTILPCKERCRIALNWDTGRYQETIYLNNRTKFMPWLQLESDILWFSRGRQILALKRKINSVASVPVRSFSAQGDDVSRFVVKNGKIVSGTRDGSLCTWDIRQNELNCEEKYAHSSDVTDVDYDGGEVIVSASKDETVKVWRLEEGEIKARQSVVAEDRVWTVALQYGSSGMLCYGTSGHHYSRSPLILYDIERHQMACLGPQVNCHRGAGILDILWEDPNTLLSCGYDSYIRMWDIRTLKCVQYWLDPFDVVLYCMASDHNHTFLTGAAQHGRVQMWDKRQTRSMQMYFMNADHSSPVYSLAFDPSHLFVALDQSLNMMDFSGFRNRAWHIAKDYRHFSYNLWHSGLG